MTWILAGTWHDDVIILLVHITLESPVPQVLWSLNLHQIYSLTKNAHWWCQRFGHLIHLYSADWTSFLLASGKIWNWCHQSTSSLMPNRCPLPLLISFSTFSYTKHSYSSTPSLPLTIKFWKKFHLTQAFKIYTHLL